MLKLVEMKKWLLVFPLVCAMAVSTPLVIGGGELLSAESREYTLSGNLGSKILPVSDYSSVTELNKDTFDGKNHTVYLSTSGEKQGLFKSAIDSTIKNVKIEWTVDLSSTNVSEFIAGGLVAEAKNTVIENCSVVFKLVGNPENGNVLRKLTFGGIVGTATGGCVIRNCSVEMDCVFDIKYPTVDYSTYIGGIAGKVKNSKIDLSVSRGEVEVNKIGDMDSNLYIGGITGSCDNGNIINVVSNLKTSVDKDLTSSKGGIVGYINGGEVKSVVYSAGTMENFGSVGELTVSSKNIIALTDETYLQRKEFYTQESQAIVVGGIENSFSWDVFGDGLWDMDSVWSVTENKLQLQAFLRFEITCARSFANKELFSTPTKTPPPDHDGLYFYEEKVTLSFNWLDNSNSKYYQITQILKNGSPVDFVVGGEGDVVLSASESGFSITISAKETSEGEYSVYLDPIPYHAYLAVGYIEGTEEPKTVITDKLNEHGSCVFEGGSITDREISVDTVLANFGVRAIAKTKNKFARWELYYKALSEAEDYIEYNGINWTKVEDVELGEIAQISGKTFGQDWANQDFLLVAHFTDNYRSILFNFDDEHIEKITAGGEEILGSNGTLNIDGTNNTTIKIYAKEGFIVDKDGLKNAFNSILNGELINEIQEISLDNRTIYSVVINGASVNTSGVNTVSVPTGEPVKEASINLGAVIGGSVAGGVVLIGLIIFLLWYFGIIGRGKYIVRKTKQAEQEKKSGDDYKKYFY